MTSLLLALWTPGWESEAYAAPLVKNYKPQDYESSPQIFDIDQDSSGVLFSPRLAACLNLMVSDFAISTYHLDSPL